jgi:hypothetical protein
LDLPVWQALRAELRPHGLEVVTVALDTDAEAARPWIEAARPEHPALIDQAHQLDELLGIVNVPSGVWIDEQGIIVRPPEPAYPHRPSFLDRELPVGATPMQSEQITFVRQLRVEHELYVAALRDWVAHGAASRYALSPAEVVRRSRPRPRAEAEAAAHFELAQHLHRLGRAEAAVEHFRTAQQLQPDNWTYKRQAWQLADKPLATYGTDWLNEVKRQGVENYYPKLEM